MNVKQLFGLTGRVAMVSGGSMGLGLQMAHSCGWIGNLTSLAAAGIAGGA